MWQRQWERTRKGALCRTFLPAVEQTLQANLPISPQPLYQDTGTLNPIYIDSASQTAKRAVQGRGQTAEHPIQHCNIIETKRDVMKHTVEMCGGTWPTANREVIAKYLRDFTTFIDSTDFDKLT
jgi:hypothetical protein